MGWRDLLPQQDQTLTLPWLGGRTVHSEDRTWKVQGRLPAEFGYYKFTITGGRVASLAGETDEFPEATNYGHKVVRGYLVGDRIIPDDARIEIDPAKVFSQTLQVWLVPPGLERFSRASAIYLQDGKLLFHLQEFPQGPEQAVQRAYQDRQDTLDHIPGVTPPLELAFRFVTVQRLQAEERERERLRLEEEERQRLAAEERLRQALENATTGAGRRHLATQDFPAAARAALEVSGSELLDTRQSANRNEMVVQFRTDRQRFECVVHKETLRVVDAGICLTDHRTNEKGDTYLTLESLPSVIREAIDGGMLHRHRHMDEYDDEGW